ncbi:TonB-dependent receptor plug domain-containing protein [Erwinia sp. E_sp_B01_9]|uniref:TonB-dependent receptor plug domain-containing protein n=1 Tax=Erwinia sp. E_sp_B01_9 TaxID=3039403 RepID=UPI003D9B4912
MQNLGDALRDVEGVVVNGAANENDISVRGMPGDYTLLLVDGKRQGGRDSRVNRQCRLRTELRSSRCGH